MKYKISILEFILKFCNIFRLEDYGEATNKIYVLFFFFNLTFCRESIVVESLGKKDNQTV